MTLGPLVWPCVLLVLPRKQLLKQSPFWPLLLPLPRIVVLSSPLSLQLAAGEVDGREAKDMPLLPLLLALLVLPPLPQMHRHDVLRHTFHMLDQTCFRYEKYRQNRPIVPALLLVAEQELLGSAPVVVLQEVAQL